MVGLPSGVIGRGDLLNDVSAAFRFHGQAPRDFNRILWGMFDWLGGQLLSGVALLILRLLLFLFGFAIRRRWRRYTHLS